MDLRLNGVHLMTPNARTRAGTLILRRSLLLAREQPAAPRGNRSSDDSSKTRSIGKFRVLGLIFLGAFMHLEPSIHAAQKLGFKLDRATIPVAEIHAGGPPRDGIPSIDRPQFVAAAGVKFLQDDDLVVSFTHAGETRAYPLRILVWHEIVNDRMGDLAVNVSYQCSLCRCTFGLTGMLIPWKNFLQLLPFPSDFLHRDEFRPRFPRYATTPLPIVLVEADDAAEVLIGADEIRSTGGLAGLIGLVQARLEEWSARNAAPAQLVAAPAKRAMRREMGRNVTSADSPGNNLPRSPS